MLTKAYPFFVYPKLRSKEDIPGERHEKKMQKHKNKLQQEHLFCFLTCPVRLGGAIYMKLPRVWGPVAFWGCVGA